MMRGEKNFPIAYISQNLDDFTRSNSTSGGVFPAIARYIIDNGGIVYGAAFDENNVVKHISINNKNDIIRLQGSKYVQSYMGDCFKNIKENLEQDKLICFSGTPCQIEGLLNFLKKDYDNLITVGVVCYGVPSPKLFRHYINYIQKKYNDELVKFYFRSKKYGYASPTVVVKFRQKGCVDSKSSIKSFTKTYFNGISLRPSCYECRMKTVEKRLDILLGDCWRTSEYENSFDDNKGTTSLFVYTKKGSELIFNILDKIKICEVSKDELLEKDCSMVTKCKERNPKRDTFFEQIDVLSYDKLVNNVVPDSFINIVANIVKPMLYKLGAENSKILKLVKNYRVKKNSKKP